MEYPDRMADEVPEPRPMVRGTAYRAGRSTALGFAIACGYESVLTYAKVLDSGWVKAVWTSARGIRHDVRHQNGSPGALSARVDGRPTFHIGSGHSDGSPVGEPSGGPSGPSLCFRG